MTKADPETFGLTRMCAVVGVSKVTVRKLVLDGVLPQELDGSYHPARFIRAYIGWKLSTGSSPKRQIDEQRARKLKRENAVADGEFVPFKFMLMAVDATCATFKQQIDAMPGRVAPLAAMQPAAIVEETIRIECARCNQAIVDAIAAVIDESKTSIDTEETET